MSEDFGDERRPSRGRDGRDEARPVTAAGRRRRAEATAGGDLDSGAIATGSRTVGKGAPTPTRDQAQSRPQGSLIARLRRYLLEVVAELRKVHWPTRRQIVTYTIVVLVFVSFMVALVALLDAVFAKAVFALFG